MSYDPVAHGALCSECPLQGCKVVPPEERPGALIAAVGEAPGEQEEKIGKPFVGPSGNEFSKSSRIAGLRRNDFHITNALLCLKGNSKVRLADGSLERIEKLVKDRYGGEVLSVCEDSDSLVPRKVTGWHRSPLGNRKLYKITTEGAKGNPKGRVGPVLTGDHTVLTASGWVRVDQLRPGDLVAVGDRALGERGLAVVLGSLLGDGCVPKGRRYLTLSHSEDHRDYLEAKARVLEGLSPSLARTHTEEMKAKGWQPRVEARTCSTRWLRGLADRYQEGRVGFSRMALAVWFLDDGYMRTRENRRTTGEINQTKLSLKVMGFYVGAIQALGIEAQVARGGRGIYFPADAFEALSALVAPYAPPSMQYKLLPKHRGQYRPELYAPDEVLCSWDAALVEEVEDRPNYVYCIDVEGTHNFVTSDAVVHNCRPPKNDLRRLLAKIHKYNREEGLKARDEKRKAEPMKTPLECCKPRLDAELASFSNFVTMGGVGTKAVTGASGSILALRGGLMELDRVPGVPSAGTIKVMPTIHPAFVLRQQRWAHVFRNDLAKAARWFRGVAKWAPPKVTYNPGPETLRRFLSDPDAVYTYDIETDSIECLTAHIRCIAIGTSDEVMVVGFRRNNRPKDQAGLFLDFYSEIEGFTIGAVLSEFFGDRAIMKAGHNAGYYDRLVLQNQMGVDPQPVIDTMILHRNVESELPHSLAYVASLYTDAPSWKTDREGNKLALGGESDEQLHEYCSNDVVITARVLPPLVDQVHLRQQVEVWRSDQKMQIICGDMHTVGMYVDQEKRLAEERKLLGVRHTLLTDIRDRLEMPKFNPGSVYQMRDVLFKEWGLDSHLDATDLKEKETMTSSGDRSTGDLILRTLLTLRTVPDDQREIIKLIRRYRKCLKVLGTYVVKLRPWNMGADLGWDDDDDWVTQEMRKKYGEEKRGIVDPRTGRMHPGYNAHVAVCVDPSTWLLTEQGPLQIGDLPGYGPAQSERGVCGWKLHDGDAFAAVSHLQNPGVCSTLRFETVLGVTLTATPHHKVKVAGVKKFLHQDSKGKWHPSEPLPVWCRMDQLSQGDYVLVPVGMEAWSTRPPTLPTFPVNRKTNANDVQLPDTVGPFLGYFAGAYNADGSLHDSNGSFSIRFSDTTGKRTEKLSRLAVALFGKDAVRVSAEGVSITSISLAPWVDAMGLGQRIENKSAPWWVLQSPRRVVVAYLQGLALDSHTGLNGGVTPCWKYTGTETLCREVQMLLFNMGIVAGLYDRTTPRQPKTWELVALGEEAQAVCQLLCFPCPPPVREGDKSQGRPKYIRRGNHLWLRVKKVEDAGKRQVYDVTIPTTHQFWANGTVSHNTGRLSSSSPINAQNFPSAQRSIVVAQPGHVLVGADMDQVELRIAAALWKVELYLRAFSENKDPHSMTAFAVFGEEFCKAAGLMAQNFHRPGKLVSACYDETGVFLKGASQAATDLRNLSKAVQYASQYMATVETVHQLIQKTELPAVDPKTRKPLNDGTTDLPYAKMKLKRTREMRDKWLNGAREFETGWQKEIDEYRRLGYLVEPVGGRRRDFLDGEDPNQIVNFKIQCYDGAMRVLTDRGWLAISSLVGEDFLAWTGHRWAPATAISKGLSPLYAVGTKSDFSVLCDASHGLKVAKKENYEWHAVGGRGLPPLRLGDKVAMSMAVPLEFPSAETTLSEEGAWVLGYWVGNGSADKRKGRTGVSWCIGTGRKGRRDSRYLSERLLSFAKSQGWHLREGRTRAGFFTIDAARGRSCPRAWLTEAGADPGWTSHTKRVPRAVLCGTLAARRAFLKGLLDADGYMTPGGKVTLHLCQRPLLEDVALVARSVGIPPNFLKGPYRADKKGHLSWRLALNASRCASELPWGRGGKLRTSRESSSPPWELDRVLPSLNATCRSDSVVRSRIKTKRAAGRDLNVSPYMLQRMGAKELYDHEQIKAITETGEVREVFTLCVDDPLHQYVAEGFISKNSSAAALMNKAIVQLHEAIPPFKWGPGTGIINQCHDSIVVECPADGAYWKPHDDPAKAAAGKGEMVVPKGSIPWKVARLLEECMNQTHPALPGVTFSATADVGLSWQKVG